VYHNLKRIQQRDWLPNSHCTLQTQQYRRLIQDKLGKNWIMRFSKNAQAT
jgi:hypothetical protein